MRILVTPTFHRTVKKLHQQQKTVLDEAVRTIASQPELGETKLGDLAGVQVFKFRMGNLQCLLAYRLLDDNTLKLLIVGPHENFYRDHLDRQSHFTNKVAGIGTDDAAAQNLAVTMGFGAVVKQQFGEALGAAIGGGAA